MLASSAGLVAQHMQANDQAVPDELNKKADALMVELLAQAGACPVGFRAEVDPRLTMRAVKKGKTDVDPTLLRLEFQPVEAKKTIVAASVTAHGVAPHGELMRVGQTTDENRTQGFELTRAEGQMALSGTEIEVTAVPFVRWVELNQITYKDGSVWHAAEGKPCRAVLSRFHPI